MKCLLAVRPGQMSLRSGKLLVSRSKVIAGDGGDRTLAWAVRLFVREQERHSGFLREVTRGERDINAGGDWRGALIDTLPADMVMLLLGCRARVAASFFAALARRTDCPQMRAYYEQLGREELGQLQFAAFAAPKISDERRHVPEVVVRCVSRAITVGIATRVWLRQRSRLRESGHTFAGFIGALLEPAA